MNSKDKPIENKDEKPTTISEKQLFESVERARQTTESACFKHFEKFHKEEMEFQRKVQLEDREYERQKRAEEKEHERRHLKSELWWKIFATILAIAGLYLFFYGSIETEKATSERAANQHRIDIIREDITEKKKIIESGSQAISSLRSVYADIIRNCRYGHPYSQERQDAMRQAAWQKIADAFAVVPYVFDENVMNKGRSLIQFDASIKDVCKYKGVIDDKALSYQREIFSLAHKSIEEDQKQIQKLK